MSNRRRILVVDDDASIRTMVRVVLERAGYEVTTARHGCEAVAATMSSTPSRYSTRRASLLEKDKVFLPVWEVADRAGS